MMINITTPRKMPYFQILLRTKKYYHLKEISDVVEDTAKNYYIFLRKRYIQIKIVHIENETLNEIEKYLDFTFENNYLGISEQHSTILQLKKVRIIKL